ncbi:unnamed protein product [Closterium sp. NIES-53]
MTRDSGLSSASRPGPAGSGSNVVMPPSWTTMEFGAPGSLLYRLLFLDKQYRAFSPWHEIPLHAALPPSACPSPPPAHGEPGLSALSFFCVTPRGTWAKFEIAQDENFTPVRVAERQPGGGPARYAENCQWNLGVLPQTWGDPRAPNEEYGGLPYDGKPVQVFDVSGSRGAARVGDVYVVKPLAAFAAVSRAPAVSWKVVAVAVDDPLALELHDVADVHRKLPGTLEEIREWLRLSDCMEPGERLIKQYLKR